MPDHLISPLVLKINSKSNPAFSPFVIIIRKTDQEMETGSDFIVEGRGGVKNENRVGCERKVGHEGQRRKKREQQSKQHWPGEDRRGVCFP